MGDPEPLQDALASSPLLLTPEEAAIVLSVGRTRGLRPHGSWPPAPGAHRPQPPPLPRRTRALHPSVGDPPAGREDAYGRTRSSAVVATSEGQRVAVSARGLDNFALHAIAHAVHVEEEFDDPRPLNTVATHSLARWAAVPRSIPARSPGSTP